MDYSFLETISLALISFLPFVAIIITHLMKLSGNQKLKIDGWDLSIIFLSISSAVLFIISDYIKNHQVLFSAIGLLGVLMIIEIYRILKHSISQQEIN